MHITVNSQTSDPGNTNGAVRTKQNKTKKGYTMLKTQKSFTNVTSPTQGKGVVKAV